MWVCIVGYEWPHTLTISFKLVDWLIENKLSIKGTTLSKAPKTGHNFKEWYGQNLQEGRNKKKLTRYKLNNINYFALSVSVYCLALDLCFHGLL